VAFRHSRLHMGCDMTSDRARVWAVKAASAVALILVAALVATLISPAGRLGVARMLAAPFMPARVAPPPTTIMPLYLALTRSLINYWP
jgi:hypothetical protein